MMDSFDQIINERVAGIIEAMSQRVAPEDVARIQAAFQFARKAHEGQTRKSGEPYIIHPVAVARIVAEEMQLGPNTVIAAFLHDVVEDTPVTLDEIREQFGDEVAFLVGVVTKKKKTNYETSKQVDNYKQMLDSVHYDIRAILLKLADRIHNMRTLESMRPDKQMKIAGETDYFYAPLANRLGFNGIRRELENLSLRYRCPQEYKSIEQQILQDQQDNQEPLKIFTGRIISLLAEHGLEVRTEIRYRQPYSIWRRMRQQGRDFKHIDFRHIIRVIFPNQPNESEKTTCLRIYSILTDVFKEKPGSIINYIDSPKENGYQSFHIKLLSEQGSWEELHISSARMTRNSRMGCVADRTESNRSSWIDKFRSVLNDLAESNEGGFMDSVVTSFYNEDIMVFTPNGKGVILPQHATALDFAFEIHKQIGEHAQYAHINGKLCSVKTELNHGDCVEIGVNPTVEPKPDWVDYVLTYKAKKFLVHYFKHVKTAPKNRCPHCHPLPGDEVIGFREADGTVTIHKRNCDTAIRQASQDGDSIVSVDFQEDMDILYPVRVRILAIDRYHLLIDIVDCITNLLHLSIDSLHTVTTDEIVDCTINFSVHSLRELQESIERLNAIKGVDEVRRERMQ